MTFHLVSGSDNEHRVGEFTTVAEAMASGMLRGVTRSESLAFIVEAPGTSKGHLVAAYDDEFGWVEVDPDEEVPSWWGKLSEQERAALLEHPRDRLTPELRDAVLRSGGPLIAAYWVESGPEGGELDFAMAARDWLMRRSMIERF